jgi:hypothetical protein
MAELSSPLRFAGAGSSMQKSTLLTDLLERANSMVPGPAVRADLNYRAEITGAEDSDLADLLDKISELKTLEDKPPASEEALRRRADRDLGRLADAAHSLGYWDAEFSYEVDIEAEPAKVTVRSSPARSTMSLRSGFRVRTFELQRRGLYHREYEGLTLRENLGLGLPLGSPRGRRRNIGTGLSLRSRRRSSRARP